MTKLMMGVALAAVMAATPALAKSKSESMKSDAPASKSDILKQEGQNREPGPNGTFQGKPVVEGPAHWSNSASNTSTSGNKSKSME